MELLSFRQERGRIIERFGSRGLVMAPIAKPKGFVLIGCMYIGQSGEVGYHQATIPQLFMVVQGSGWVTDETQKRQRIEQGQAAYWHAGEFHGAGSEVGMTALVMEADELDPHEYLSEVDVMPT